MVTLDTRARDAILDFMEKEERLFKDYEKNVSPALTDVITFDPLVINTNTIHWRSREGIVYGI